jgi:hypothetical protein
MSKVETKAWNSWLTILPWQYNENISCKRASQVAQRIKDLACELNTAVSNPTCADYQRLKCKTNMDVFTYMIKWCLDVLWLKCGGLITTSCKNPQHRLVTSLCCVSTGDQTFLCFGHISWSPARPASSHIMMACKVMIHSYGIQPDSAYLQIWTFIHAKSAFRMTARVRKVNKWDDLNAHKTRLNVPRYELQRFMAVYTETV